MNLIKENLRRKLGAIYHFKGNPPPVGVSKCFPFEYDGKSFDGYTFVEKSLSDEDIEKYNLTEELGEGWTARIFAEDEYDETHDFAQEIINEVNKNGIAVYTANGDYGIIYAPSTRGGYQATYFGPNGLVGHVQRDTLEQTIKDAWREYGIEYIKLISPEELDERAKSWDNNYNTIY